MPVKTNIIPTYDITTETLATQAKHCEIFIIYRLGVGEPNSLSGGSKNDTLY